VSQWLTCKIIQAREIVMALLDDIVNGGNLVTGLVVGAGALIVWPLIGPIARPIVKALIKGGLIAYRGAEQLYTDAVAGIGEIAREAQQEIGGPTASQRHVGGE
jgi:hypothetical protein